MICKYLNKLYKDGKIASQIEERDQYISTHQSRSGFRGRHRPLLHGRNAQAAAVRPPLRLVDVSTGDLVRPTSTGESES